MTTQWIINWSIGLLGFAVIFGYFITALFTSKLRKHAEEGVTPDKVMAFWTGTIERLFFTLLVAFEMSGIPTVLVAWIIFKVAPDWDRLKKETQAEDLKGPAFVRLLGNVLSMIFALVGGLICSGKIPLLLLLGF
jgi:hypothetical protein